MMSNARWSLPSDRCPTRLVKGARSNGALGESKRKRVSGMMQEARRGVERKANAAEVSGMDYAEWSRGLHPWFICCCALPLSPCISGRTAFLGIDSYFPFGSLGSPNHDRGSFQLTWFLLTPALGTFFSTLRPLPLPTPLLLPTSPDCCASCDGSPRGCSGRRPGQCARWHVRDRQIFGVRGGQARPVCRHRTKQ